MKSLRLLLLALSLVITADGQQRPVYQGQGPTVAVETTSRPIEKQTRSVQTFSNGAVSFSNDFDGSRMNAVTMDGPSSFTVTITPENTPVNPSPWYAFKVKSRSPQTISVRLVYPEGVRHRYSPLISDSGTEWKPLDRQFIKEFEKGSADFGPSAGPRSIEMTLNVGKRWLWVSGQELETSKKVYSWMSSLTKYGRVQIKEIGKSTEGRSLKMMSFGNLKSKKNIVVISRQHPPEVTGYFAMQAFVEAMLADSQSTRAFLKEWAVFVVPMMNPDGVDGGHWRHNAGGVDLNRDWTVFNQPEGRAVSAFLSRREAESGGRFYFGIDFHSTWDDIYYPMDRKFQSSAPGLIYEWLDAIKTSIPGYEPNIRPTENLDPAIVSRNYFFKSHGMEAIVFEIGDNTSRDFIRKKGEVGAIELMRLLSMPGKLMTATLAN